MRISLGPIPLMEAGQPLEFDAVAASTYLKETTAEHGTVEIAVSIGGRAAAFGVWRHNLWFSPNRHRRHAAGPAVHAVVPWLLCVQSCALPAILRWLLKLHLRRALAV